MTRKKSLDNEYDAGEVARLYLSGMSQRAVGTAVGLGQSSVSRILRRNGVETRPAHGRRRYTLDEGYFECISTPEKAYWLGFIAADGGIRPGDSALMVHLGRDDASHLVKMARALGSDTSVKNTPTGVAVVFNSPRLVASLGRCGITRRKSYLCKPWAGPAHLMPHYWRGAMDGDGHISRSMPYIAFAGTHAMVEAFLTFASGVCGTKATPRPSKGSAAWHVMLCGRLKIPQILQALYMTDGPVLDRKKVAAQSLIARYPAKEPVVCMICGGKNVARRLCGKHYQHWVKYRDVDAPIQIKYTPRTA